MKVRVMSETMNVEKQFLDPAGLQNKLRICILENSQLY
jgi:hypothetical protein